MADFNKPDNSTLKTDVLSEIKDRALDVATMSAPSSNIPTNYIRWNSGSANFDQWNGAAWGALSTSFNFAITPSVTLAGLLTVDGAGSDLDADKLDGQHGAYYLAASSYTAADVLAKLKTVDVNGTSGVNAGTFDALESGQFLRSDAADTKSAGDLTFSDNVKFLAGSGGDLAIYHDGTNSLITEQGDGDLIISSTSGAIRLRTNTNEEALVATQNAAVSLYYDGVEKLRTTTDGVLIVGTGAIEVPEGTTAQRPTGSAGMFRYNSTDATFEGFSGGIWGPVGGGATGGSTDAVFHLNGTNVTADYTIPANNNAGSFGPITIDNGVTVTIPDGLTWSVV